MENTQENVEARIRRAKAATSKAEATYFARLSELSPSELLAEWESSEQASHLEPESYKPEYVQLLLTALRAALDAGSATGATN